MIESNQLYEIDRRSGQATQVGSLAGGFGVSENNPRALAYVGSAGSGNLYLAGNSTYRLYEIRLPVGQAATWTGNASVPIGGVREVATITTGSFKALAASGSTLYAVHGNNAGPSISTVNLSTGALTATANARGHGLTNITGITYSGTSNIFYVVTSSSTVNGTLHTVDVSTSGAATRIGSSDGLIGVMRVHGIVNFNRSSAPTATNPLYVATWANSGSLYTVNSTTGVGTRVTVTNFALATREQNPVGLAYGGSTLYMIGQNTSGARPPVYTINTTTGVATKDGNAGSGLNYQIAGLHFYNNYLYTFSTSSAKYVQKTCFAIEWNRSDPHL